MNPFEMFQSKVLPNELSDLYRTSEIATKATARFQTREDRLRRDLDEEEEHHDQARK